VLTIGSSLAYLVLVLAAALRLQAAPATAVDQWAKELAAFEEQDKQSPAVGGIVFVGSSSIRLWDLGKSFPGAQALNRGFGGSQIVDSVNHVDLLVIRHKPRVVIFYAGDNDLAAGRTPQQVAADFQAFVSKVRAALPETRIAFIGIKPSIQRWALIDKIREATRRSGRRPIATTVLDSSTSTPPCSAGTRSRGRTSSSATAST